MQSWIGLQNGNEKYRTLISSARYVGLAGSGLGVEGNPQKKFLVTSVGVIFNHFGGLVTIRLQPDVEDSWKCVLKCKIAQHWMNSQHNVATSDHWMIAYITAQNRVCLSIRQASNQLNSQLSVAQENQHKQQLN